MEVATVPTRPPHDVQLRPATFVPVGFEGVEQDVVTLAGLHGAHRDQAERLSRRGERRRPRGAPCGCRVDDGHGHRLPLPPGGEAGERPRERLCGRRRDADEGIGEGDGLAHPPGEELGGQGCRRRGVLERHQVVLEQDDAHALPPVRRQAEEAGRVPGVVGQEPGVTGLWFEGRPRALPGLVGGGGHGTQALQARRAVGHARDHFQPVTGAGLGQRGPHFAHHPFDAGVQGRDLGDVGAVPQEPVLRGRVQLGAPCCHGMSQL